jgi:hypothetical protein
VEGFPAAAAGRADRAAVDSDLADLQVVEEPAAVGVPAVRLSDKRSCNRARAAADAVAVVAAPAAGVEAIRVTRPSIRST